MGLLTDHQLAFIFGLLGNIVSFMVFLAPVPTFYTIYKKKTSAGFQSIPYVVALLSAMLLLYYGFLKTNAILIITINSIGCVIEVTYIILYLIYAPKKEKMFTMALVMVVNIGAYGLMMAITIFLFDGIERVNAVGWTCAAFNLAVFAAPLSIMKQVMTTKSVEYMPFSLSLFLTLCATMWFFYGLFVKDHFITVPNVVGFLLGISQMVLYIIYKDAKEILDTKHEDQDTNKTKWNPPMDQEPDSKTSEMKMMIFSTEKPLKSNASNQYEIHSVELQV